MSTIYTTQELTYPDRQAAATAVTSDGSVHQVSALVVDESDVMSLLLTEGRRHFIVLPPFLVVFVNWTFDLFRSKWHACLDADAPMNLTIVTKIQLEKMLEYMSTCAEKLRSLSSDTPYQWLLLGEPYYNSMSGAAVFDLLRVQSSCSLFRSTYKSCVWKGMLNARFMICVYRYWTNWAFEDTTQSCAAILVACYEVHSKSFLMYI